MKKLIFGIVCLLIFSLPSVAQELESKLLFEVTFNLKPGVEIGQTRTTPYFETNSKKLDYLNHTVCVGVGTIVKPGETVSYKVYQIL